MRGFRTRSPALLYKSSSNICVRLCKLNQIASLWPRCKSCLLAFAQPSAGKVHGSGSGTVSWLQTNSSLCHLCNSISLRTPLAQRYICTSCSFCPHAPLPFCPPPEKKGGLFRSLKGDVFWRQHCHRIRAHMARSFVPSWL